MIGGINLRNNKYISLKNEKGFTLVEVIVSIGILSFGLLAVAAMQNSALLGTTKSKSVTEATTVGMDRMERIFAMPFDTLNAYAPGTYTDSDLPVAPPALPSNIEYVNWKVSNSASLPSDSAKIIEITVKSKSMKNIITLKNIKLKIS